MAVSGETSGSQEGQNDDQRKKVTDWVEGTRAVQDRVFEKFIVESEGRAIGGVDAGNADEIMARLEAAYGETYPELFPDTTGLELGHDRRVSDVYVYPDQHAHAPQGTLKID